MCLVSRVPLTVRTIFLVPCIPAGCVVLSLSSFCRSWRSVDSVSFTLRPMVRAVPCPVCRCARFFHRVCIRFSACGAEYYSAAVDGQLSGCLESSVVCSRLDTIVSSGRELCQRFDLKLADSKSSTCYSGAGETGRCDLSCWFVGVVLTRDVPPQFPPHAACHRK